MLPRCLVALALVVAGLLATACGIEGHAARATETAPSTQLLVLDGSALRTVDAGTGRIVHQVSVGGSALALGDLSVSPDGRTAYAERSAPLCRDTAVVAIDLVTGHERVVVAHATNPALSPDGRELAYTAAVAPPEQSGDPQACATGNVVVSNLRSGARRTWHLTSDSLGDSISQLVAGLTWAPNGRDLLVTSFGRAQILQVLDTTQPESEDNPATVGAATAYDTPVMLRNGAIMGLVATCSDGAGCPPVPTPASQTVEVVAPRGRGVLSRFDEPRGLVALLIDPSGREIEAVVAGRSTVMLARLVGHRLVPTRTFATQQLSAAWVPGRI